VRLHFDRTAAVYYPEPNELGQLSSSTNVRAQAAQNLARYTCTEYLSITGPVDGHRPAWGLYAAVTRQDAEAQPEGGWTPTQRLSVVEALRAFTSGAARAIERDDMGVIAVGARADLTVLRQDPLEVAPAELRALGIVATIVEGRLRRVE